MHQDKILHTKITHSFIHTHTHTLTIHILNLLLHISTPVIQYKQQMCIFLSFGPQPLPKDFDATITDWILH